MFEGLECGKHHVVGAVEKALAVKLPALVALRLFNLGPHFEVRLLPPLQHILRIKSPFYFPWFALDLARIQQYVGTNQGA